jgi:Bacterial pre-peptidase C-terminal domain
MRSKHFLVASVVVGSFTALAGAATGCGGGGADNGTGGSSGDGGATSSSATATTTTAASTTTAATTNSVTAVSVTSVTTGGGANNHDFGTAVAIELNTAKRTAGTLVDVDKTKDFYRFQGKSGERITLIVRAQDLAMTNGSDPRVVDTVVTVFDANKTQLAQNDDVFPRDSTDSQLFTVLPTDGIYYVAIEGCASAFPGANCGNSLTVTTLDYDLLVLDTDKVTVPEAFEKPEPNNDAATATQVPYKVVSGTNYGFYFVDGAFKDATDVDAFDLKIPANVSTALNQRPHAHFWLQPIGSDNGTGAAANARLQLFDIANPGTPIAEVNQSNYGAGGANGPAEFSVPVLAGHEYTLLVSNASATATPTKDYYFLQHYAGSYWLEVAEASPDANDDLMKPEALKLLNTNDPGHYFVDGDLSSDTDVDYFSMDIPSTAKLIAMECAAQRLGSGLRKPKWTLLKTDGSKISADSELTESATVDGNIGYTTDIKLPTGTTKVLLKVESTSPRDPKVTGTYYRCRIQAG